jgi:hypothetical protein
MLIEYTEFMSTSATETRDVSIRYICKPSLVVDYSSTSSSTYAGYYYSHG